MLKKRTMDQDKINAIESKLIAQGKKRVEREDEVNDFTYYRSEITFSNPNQFSGPPASCIVWDDNNM